MTLYCAIDLHSNNNVPVVIDEQDTILLQKRLPNDLPTVLRALLPFQSELQGVAVESTFNWYWLVDGLDEAGFPTQLVNPCAVQQYKGLKHTNDDTDAFWLAHLMRLGILPTGYIYPKGERPVRDLLRKRLQLVRHRVTHMLSAQNQLWRSTGRKYETNRIKKADLTLLNDIPEPDIQTAIKANLAIIEVLTQQITQLESIVKARAIVKPELPYLLTMDGIGNILGQTILLETGDIHRFAAVGNFASYCRCVNSRRFSNQKQKGMNNAKNGNKYLAWAFIEAAHSIIRYNKTAHRFYQRKRAQVNGALATKALAHKLARAAYFIMRDKVPYRPELLFG
ncbi:MAG: IS110 family transposase [Gammaproteobacteria bacterium]